jgi:esterase/lipase superfamily enzyme
MCGLKINSVVGAALLTLLVATGLLAGCASTPPHMMPTPAIFKDPRLDYAAQLPPALRSTHLPVFYSTTRLPVAAGDSGHYGTGQSDIPRLGVAHVSLGEPGWTWDELIASDAHNTIDQVRPGQVNSIEEFGTVSRDQTLNEAERAFVARIDARLAKSRNQEIAVYVHGYRVNFDEVSVQMGSFAHYLGHGAMVTFQWPTGENFWNYLTDCPNAERNIPDIEHLVAVLAQTRAENINVIAYSCGSPLMAEALVRLRARHPQETRTELAKRYRLGNVIFVASDIDLKIFSREYLPPIMDLAQQTIVYVSRNDAALGFSTLLAGTSRLGRPDIADLTVEDLQRLAADPRLQVVDVSDVRGAHEMGGMKGHGYWYANDWISTDVTISLRKPIAPPARCLVPGPKTNIWKLPENYEQCLADRLLKAFPELRRAGTP